MNSTINSSHNPKDSINNKNIDLKKLIEESRLNVTDKFSTPPVVLKIDDSIVGTLGNFSASTGKAKSRKTFNLCSIAAAFLSNGEVLNYRGCLPDGKKKVLFIDTEQSKYHCKKVLDRIIKLAGFSQDYQPENLEFLSLRPFEPEMRTQIIEYSLEHTDGLGVVIIDGIRDLAYDINSPSEATNLITKLMRWTGKLNIHLHTVLHQNKGDNNSRGHLGTELNNKAESIITVTKDEINPEISIVESEMLRDIDFETFAFSINESGLPYLIEDYTSAKPKQTKGFTYDDVPGEKHIEALNNIFHDGQSLMYKQLVSQIKVVYSSMGFKLGENKAKGCLTFLQNKRMIIKDLEGYKLNPNGYY